MPPDDEMESILQEFAPQKGQPEKKADKVTVLVVDDHSHIRKVLCHILGNAGYLTLDASRGAQALEILAGRKDIPVVLMDIMMPDLDGYATCFQINQDRAKYGRPSVIMVSAKSERADVLLGIKHGAIDYVVKPFHKNTVLQKVARAIELHQRGPAPEEQGDPAPAE
ncbi:MAG: response regulator [Planctomycetota bacterium]|nr:response regulator [Planctomycetota bacterium]